MYKVISSEAKTDSGKNIIFYGIKSKEIEFPDLSTDKKSVKRLCKLCNKHKIKDEQLLYVIEDFLCSNTGLSTIFTR